MLSEVEGMEVLPQQTLKRTGFARGLKPGCEPPSGGGRHRNTRRWPPHGIQEAAMPLCDFQDAEHCTVRGPKPLYPWRQWTTFEGGEPPSNKPHKLKQQALQQLSTRTENRGLSVQYSWCFSASLALPAVLSETQGREWGRGWKGTNECGWPASQAVPSIFKLIPRTIKWDAFCLSAICCSKKSFQFPVAIS